MKIHTETTYVLDEDSELDCYRGHDDDVVLLREGNSTSFRIHFTIGQLEVLQELVAVLERTKQARIDADKKVEEKL